MKNQEIKVEAFVALTHGKLMEWYGGDGCHVPMWLEKKSIGDFRIWNKFHKPKIVKCTITYSN